MVIFRALQIKRPHSKERGIQSYIEQLTTIPSSYPTPAHPTTVPGAVLSVAAQSHHLNTPLPPQRVTGSTKRQRQGWQVVAKVVFTTGFNRLKPAGKNTWWQKVAKSGKKSNVDN